MPIRRCIYRFVSQQMLIFKSNPKSIFRHKAYNLQQPNNNTNRITQYTIYKIPSLIPHVFRLLPIIVYGLSTPTACYLLPIIIYQLSTPTAYCLMPIAYCLKSACPCGSGFPIQSFVFLRKKNKRISASIPHAESYFIR